MPGYRESVAKYIALINQGYYNGRAKTGHIDKLSLEQLLPANILKFLCHIGIDY